MIRATKWESLYLETFLAQILPEYRLDCFLALLEKVAEPYASVGISNRMITDEDVQGDSAKRPTTESKREECHENGQPETQLASWYYRLSNSPTSSADGRARLYTGWFPLNTVQQYERMSKSIKEHNISAVFARTCEIDETVPDRTNIQTTSAVSRATLQHKQTAPHYPMMESENLAFGMVTVEIVSRVVSEQG
ncbi:hypothetical protein F5Y06DRAFT_294615 [Hypoxylon sp. FL0890]|nr:hypothetical protein F5Y06DRAFT_294615 [Hypoxylon sp. FL0890]